MNSPEEPNIGWVPWTPETAKNWVYQDVARAIEDFKPVDRPAGHAATAWLRLHALDSYPTTTTWLHYADGKLEGFFSICVSNFTLHDTVKDKLPGQGRRPASEVTWICKGAESSVAGRDLLKRAVAIGQKTWGNEEDAVLVINPYDADTADFLKRRWVLWDEPGSERLWMPLHSRGN